MSPSSSPSLSTNPSPCKPFTDLKAIVFDLDDTLFPEHQFVYSGFHAVSDWMRDHYNTANFFDVTWRLFLEGKRGTIFDQALAELQIPFDAALIRQLVQVYHNHTPKLTLHEDARWALEYFRSQKKLGLITNGFVTTQQNKVRALGIESYFDFILYCGTLERTDWKPSPVPYQKWMEAVDCEGESCVYVGDHPQKDFVGARHWNWKTIRICREDGEYGKMVADVDDDADLSITSLYELQNIC